jgi:hypothetical protein
MNFGEISMRSLVTEDTLAVVKQVAFRPSTAADTVRVGDLVCYNSDLAADWKEATSNRLTGNLGGENATTYAEGVQAYNARFLVVEKPASTNVHAFAGVVAKLGDKGGADGDLIHIYPLVDGAVVPVMTDLSVTANDTVLACNMGQYEATNPVYGGTTDGSRIIGVALETVDRSSTDGLVWMRMSTSGLIGIVGGNGGVSANRLGIGVGASSGTLYGDFLSLVSRNTGGYLVGKRLRVEASGAGSAIVAFQVDGIVSNASQAGTCQASSTTLTWKSGATSGAHQHFVAEFKYENQDGTPANLSSATLHAVLRLNSNISSTTAPAANTVWWISANAEGADKPDGLLFADGLTDIGAYVSTGDAPALATGDVMIPVRLAGTTYYLVALADTGV